jgi:hypothetical protein
MIRFSLYDDRVQIPTWVDDLEAFRRWSDDDAFPETGHICFLKGDVWVDMSKEQLFDHNDVKGEINMVLHALVKTHQLGRYLTYGAFLSNVAADVSNQPDGMFVSTASLQQGKVRVVEGRARGHVELEGTPDMVLEVVSDGSVEKDTVVLRQAYAEGGASANTGWSMPGRSRRASTSYAAPNGGMSEAARAPAGCVPTCSTAGFA